jgi:hypothetical protein
MYRDFHPDIDDPDAATMLRWYFDEYLPAMQRKGNPGSSRRYEGLPPGWDTPRTDEFLGRATTEAERRGAAVDPYAEEDARRAAEHWADLDRKREGWSAEDRAEYQAGVDEAKVEQSWNAAPLAEWTEGLDPAGLGRTSASELDKISGPYNMDNPEYRALAIRDADAGGGWNVGEPKPVGDPSDYTGIQYSQRDQVLFKNLLYEDRPDWARKYTIDEFEQMQRNGGLLDSEIGQQGPPGTPLGVTGDPDFQTIEEATREAMGIEDALDDIGLFPEGQELMPYWENVAIKSGYIHGMPDTAAAGESLHDYLNRLYFDTDESLHAVYEKIYDHAFARLEELDQFISSPRPHGGLGRRPGDGTNIWQDGHPLDRNPGPDERRPLPDTYTLEEQNEIWREEIDRINWDGVLQGSPVEDYGSLFDELIRDQRKVALRNLGSGISIGGAAAVTAGTVFPEQVEKVVSGLASFNDGWWSWIKEFPEHLDWVVRTTGATVDGMEQGTRSTGSPVLDGLSDGFREEAGSWMGSMGGGVVPVVGRQDASVLKGLSKDLSEQGHNGQAMFPNDIRREIENGDAMIVGYRSDADYERAVAESGEYGIEVDRHFWRKPNRKNIRPAEGQPWTSEHLKKLATTNYFYPDAGLRRGPR